MAHYQKEKRVKSIMLEVNRGIYMDEKTIEKKPNFPEIQRIVTGFLSLLEKKERSI
jgi:N-formylglutamate amidohydrolase